MDEELIMIAIAMLRCLLIATLMLAALAVGCVGAKSAGPFRVCQPEPVGKFHPAGA